LSARLHDKTKDLGDKLVSLCFSQIHYCFA